jgi:hypothetical protein
MSSVLPWAACAAFRPETFVFIEPLASLADPTSARSCGH